jgi:hypothetical protein
VAARQYSKMSGAPLQEAYTAILPIQTAVRGGVQGGGGEYLNALWQGHLGVRYRVHKRRPHLVLRVLLVVKDDSPVSALVDPKGSRSTCVARRG